jgi:hypothetical protein
MRSHQAVRMNSDFKELLRIFNANEVKYFIVGRYAVMLYTEPRYTKDLDVWGQANSENAAEEAWSNRKQSHLGAQTGWFIGREDLLNNKRTTGRHIDLHYAA